MGAGSLLMKVGSEFYAALVERGPEIAGYVWFGASDRPFSQKKGGWIYDIQVVRAEKWKWSERRCRGTP